MKVPFFVMAASVPKGNRVVQFHGTGPDTAAALLSNIPRFRYASFDVAIPDSPRVGPDDSLELQWDDRKLLRLYQDGTLISRVRADYEFLGWGAEPAKFERFPRLNPVPCVEVQASFVYLYARVIERLKQPPGSVQFKLTLRDAAWNGHRLFLTRYFPSGHVDWALVTKYQVQMTNPESEIQSTPSEVTDMPNRAAYRLVETFVSWFDMPPDQIPFVRDGNSGREVDLDAIKKLS